MTDRIPQLLARAIAVTSLVVVAAVVGVLLSLWLGGPARTAPPGPAPRGRSPLLMNAPDGTIYDVHLKQVALEERIVEEEARSKQLLEELGELRKRNEQQARELRALDAEVGRLRRDLARRPAPAPEEPPAPANTPPVTPVPEPAP